MNLQILKPIIAGLLIGAAFFWMPFFILKVLIFLLILGFIFRLFGGRRGIGYRRWAYADKIRSMSEEEYAKFKDRYARGCASHRDPNENENK